MKTKANLVLLPFKACFLLCNIHGLRLVTTADVIDFFDWFRGIHSLESGRHAIDFRISENFNTGANSSTTRMEANETLRFKHWDYTYIELTTPTMTCCSWCWKGRPIVIVPIIVLVPTIQILRFPLFEHINFTIDDLGLNFRMFLGLLMELMFMDLTMMLLFWLTADCMIITARDFFTLSVFPQTIMFITVLIDFTRFPHSSSLNKQLIFSRIEQNLNFSKLRSLTFLTTIGPLPN